MSEPALSDGGVAAEAALDARQMLEELDHPADEARPRCFECGPGYRLGDEGCAHGKACTHCHKVKPSDETGFYKDKRARDGLSSWCRQCMNSLPKAQTRTRIIRNRARHRAVQMLVENHPEEFAILYELCRADAEEEDERISSSPEVAAQFEGATPRLRTGRRKPNEEPEARVNQTWCPRCAVFHAMDHHTLKEKGKKSVAECFKEFNEGTARAGAGKRA